jgi:TPP-dependent pyruvate/acetoin dehydrogenase alpha subunit
MLAVYDAARTAVDRARAGEGPSLVGVDTMRMRGHAEHDDMRYVPKTMLEDWAGRDAIARFRTHLRRADVAGEAELAEVDGTSKAFAETEALEAERAPWPDAETAGDGVYAGEDAPRFRVEFVQSPFASSPIADRRSPIARS